MGELWSNGSASHRISVIDALVRPIPIGIRWQDSASREGRGKLDRRREVGYGGQASIRRSSSAR
jgi:hypothetical protein